ncbi:MAG: hypothetical protein J6U23_03895 [Clostridiales bacterium]|nr:hypothetical protein [Clostridiales bacterium]
MEDTGNDYESSVEYRIKREKLNALLSATRTSRDDYNEDINNLYSALNEIDTSSLLLDSYREKIMTFLSRNDYSDDFDLAIRWISNNL